MMFVLLTGGNDSGKSRCAERIASQVESRRFYAATMVPWGAEGEARKAKHIRQRAGLNFVTVECPRDLSAVPCGLGDLALLEDVSNLLANLTFEGGCDDPEEEAFAQVLDLRDRCSTLLAVTIWGLSPTGDERTQEYVRSLNRLNARLAEAADVVVQMREHVPYVVKGVCRWELV